MCEKEREFEETYGAEKVEIKYAGNWDSILDPIENAKIEKGGATNDMCEWNQRIRSPKKVILHVWLFQLFLSRAFARL